MGIKYRSVDKVKLVIAGELPDSLHTSKARLDVLYAKGRVNPPRKQQSKPHYTLEFASVGENAGTEDESRQTNEEELGDFGRLESSCPTTAGDKLNQHLEDERSLTLRGLRNYKALLTSFVAVYVCQH